MIGYYASIFMLIYLHVIRLYWNWHTCIPYALEHPRNIGVSAWYKSREDDSEGSLKMLNHRRVVHKQIIYQPSERPS